MVGMHWSHVAFPLGRATPLLNLSNRLKRGARMTSVLREEGLVTRAAPELTMPSK
jgi:hypothetical protein